MVKEVLKAAQWLDDHNVFSRKKEKIMTWNYYKR